MQTGHLGPLDEHRGPIHVVGHKNPDTDSVASAVGYAWLLRERDKLEAQPARAGQLNAQTLFVLSSFGLEAPPLIVDASARFEHVVRLITPLAPEQPLQEGFDLVVKTGRVAPVVSANGEPFGLLTGATVFEALARHLTGRPGGLAGASLGEFLAFPCGEAADREVPRFDLATRIRDVLPRVLREERDLFFVVDAAGRYAGIAIKPDLLRPPHLRLVLIDHNESAQSVGGLDEAEILEVIDHHRLSNPPTHMPIAFLVDPVGSSCTLVTERAIRTGIALPKGIAGALLSGIVSDTLLLKSPTTTDRDRVAAVQLSAWAFAGKADPYQAMLDYGAALLAAGAGLGTRSAQEIVSQDYKSYEAGSVRFGLSQVEVTDLHELEGRLVDLRAALKDQVRTLGLTFAALMVTDIVGGRSRLVVAGELHGLDALPYRCLPDETLDLPGVVSRKKQLLPTLLGAIK